MRAAQVHNAVQAARAKRGMTQQELADRAGLARQSIISIEKGRFLPTIENALRIAAALGVPVQDLFWLSKEGVT
jgi:putative transcriptional regulator